MPELPTGTVTFLSTDIEGSTRLLQELGGAAYGTMQDQHSAIVARVDEEETERARTEGFAMNLEQSAWSS